MNERHSEPTEHDDATEERIAYIMDTRGISRTDAEIAIAGWVKVGAAVTPATYEESVRQHPAAASTRRTRVRYGRPPVGYDSEDVSTGYIDEKQAKINARGAALVRATFRVDNRELSGHELAIERAKREKKDRGYL
jgi:hypothetical protein